MNDVTDPLLIDLAKAAYTDPAARDALHDYWEDRGGQLLLLRCATGWEQVGLWSRLVADRCRSGMSFLEACAGAGGFWAVDPVINPELFDDATFTADLTLNQTVLRQTVGDFRAPIPTYRGGP